MVGEVCVAAGPRRCGAGRNRNPGAHETSESLLFRTEFQSCRCVSAGPRPVPCARKLRSGPRTELGIAAGSETGGGHRRTTGRVGTSLVLLDSCEKVGAGCAGDPAWIWPGLP